MNLNDPSRVYIKASLQVHINSVLSNNMVQYVAQKQTYKAIRKGRRAEGGFGLRQVHCFVRLKGMEHSVARVNRKKSIE